MANLGEGEYGEFGDYGEGYLSQADAGSGRLHGEVPQQAGHHRYDAVR